MTVYERIKQLCADNRVTVSKMEQEIGISKGATYKWKTSSPSMEVLQKLADFFNVSTQYIITGQDSEWQPTITEKDEKDIKKKLDALINQLSTDTGLMYDGEPMDNESLNAVRAALEVAERTAMLEARRKFTPDKYKK